MSSLRGFESRSLRGELAVRVLDAQVEGGGEGAYAIFVFSAMMRVVVL